MHRGRDTGYLGSIPLGCVASGEDVLAKSVTHFNWD
jgi:hypothetical protein